LQETSRLLKQIAGAVDYAHDNGVLHRDIKPSNILVDSQRNAFLTDFGIAKIVEGTLDLTGTGILGTPQYMSPEQCRGEKDLPPASDQYALGVVLYEMVTGRTPYQAETPLAVIQKQILGEPLPPPSSLRPDLPDDVEKVILKALAREPQERFPACLKMAEAFEKAIQGYTPPELTETPTADALKMPLYPKRAWMATGTIHKRAMPRILIRAKGQAMLVRQSACKMAWKTCPIPRLNFLMRLCPPKAQYKRTVRHPSAEQVYG
jgi:serine/threonine protein kinase